MLDCIATGYAASVSSVDIFFPHPKRQAVVTFMAGCQGLDPIDPQDDIRVEHSYFPESGPKRQL